MKTGSCLCGAVTFEVSGDLRPSVACHCTQCRKTSGHYWSATQVPSDRLTLTRSDGLQWYQSSPTARRGFCSVCGSSLFWEMDGEGATSIGTGTLDGDTGLHTEKHIFVADKGDYYEIADGLPQKEQG
ncbi:GFA family protein [Neptunicoccus cionae]|uniref:GFA family protein n=1 Tax=Neptunicoccus cionae TaxID=2035344 RepID=UPI000C788484|nr:GFA family protein [Amylibacter cionae]PLS20046.1 aldehyde-activating protein [Amylibacter cionae]